MHDHNDCEHEMKYCKVCDVAYCKKCKREWGKTVYVPYYYNTWVYPNTTTPYTITVGSTYTITDSGFTYLNTGFHAH